MEDDIKSEEERREVEAQLGALGGSENRKRFQKTQPQTLRKMLRRRVRCGDGRLRARQKPDTSEGGGQSEAAPSSEAAPDSQAAPEKVE